jgi:hypothetical protein
MGRNLEQERALRRAYAAKRDDTRAAFERALSKIAENPAVVLTAKSLYMAAGRSRATLNRYPDIKVRLAAMRDARQRESSASSQQAALSNEPTAASRLRRVQDVTDRRNRAIS